VRYNLSARAGWRPRVDAIACPARHARGVRDTQIRAASVLIELTAAVRAER
jgi:hypothetical protein